MTKTNKLILGGVVLVAVLFFYDRNKKMKEAQAQVLKQSEREAEALMVSNGLIRSDGKLKPQSVIDINRRNSTDLAQQYRSQMLTDNE